MKMAERNYADAWMTSKGVYQHSQSLSRSGYAKNYKQDETL